VKLFVGVTNNDWFRYLSARRPDEVNFWRPRSQMEFRALNPGDIFLFKLHSPLDYIAGGGVYLKHTFLPLHLAWQSFGDKNGVPDFKTFERAILAHRPAEKMHQQLGCTILVEPFFWPEGDWIRVPSDWSKNIVAGKGYDTKTESGAALWAEVQARIAGKVSAVPVGPSVEEPARYGPPRLVKPRLGQGAFRVEVTDAYQRRCAVTGEKTLPALEAAHIKPYADNGPHEVRNGLLLRSDLHNLFDQGYLTVTNDHRVEVSRRIREEFNNGRHYYALQGQRLEVLPSTQDYLPGVEYLEWHQQNVFKS
jgi:putative restriction endonuclease